MTHPISRHQGSDPARQPPQGTHLEIDMVSALSPREIQARIRAGESLEEVAKAAGMGIEWAEPFAAPVIAEREFIASQAQSRPVRRGAETIAHRTLGEVVNDRLSSRKVDLSSVEWDAWKLEGRRWTIRVDYDSGKTHREALFIYDAGGRFSVAENDDARWLLGLHSSSHGPQPGRRRREDDAEPTVGLNDDLVLVRVVQPRADEADSEETTRIESPDPPPVDHHDEVDDAYAEGELEEVDGVYDIVPSTGAGIDVLYDMLSSFDEDSVQIYAGLIRPEDPPRQPVLDESVQAEPEADPPKSAGAAPKAAATASKPRKRPRPKADPKPPSPSDSEDTAQAEPEQPTLVDKKPDTEPRPKRKRAAVPSWDEIIFGAPKTPKKH